MRRFFTVITCFALSLSVQAFAIDLTKDVCGRVVDTEGNPVAGVVVSDSYTAVATDADGRYFFERNAAANYVFVSIPAEYAVPLRQGLPCFYRKLDDKRETYDFVLEALKKKEESFNIFFIGDPQCQNTYHVNRLINEGIADMKAYSKRVKGNSYAITLGDIAYTEGGRNTNYLLPIMRQEFAKEKTGMPVFQTVGNHDFEFALGALDEWSPTPALRKDRMFEAIFGPVDYSWNRGDVHFIAMNDVRFESVEKHKYSAGLSDAQFEWLKQDLSFVPEDKMVVLSLHIPISTKSPARVSDPGKKHDMENLFAALDLLAQYSNPMVFTGHTHTNFKHTFKCGVREFTVGAMSGCWWWSRNCADGSPNGYLVCSFKGNKLDSYIYKSLGFSDKHQMRIYRGDAVFGGKYEAFPLPFGRDVLLINVFNWDKGWKVQVYEDGALAADLAEPMPVDKNYVPAVDSSKDWWAIGYNVGVVGRGHMQGSTRNNYCERCYHMFRHQMKNPDAKVKVVVTDASGRVFTETKVYESSSWEEADYTEATPPPYGDSQIF